MSGLLKEGFSRRVCLFSESLGASRESIYLFANGGFYCPKQQDYGVYDLLEGVELTFYWRGREPERLQWRAAGQSYRSEDGAWLVLSEERLASPLTAGAITCSGKTDGLGAQAQGVMSVMLFADWMNLRYVHTPFRRMAHAPGGEGEWAAACEAFLGLGIGEPSSEALGLPRMPAATLEEVLRRRHEGGVGCAVVPHAHAFADAFPDLYGTIQESLRRRFSVASRAAWGDEPASSGAAICVALHVRRGDVRADNEEAFRHTSDAVLLRMIDSLEATLHGLGVRSEVHLYSEGPAEAFDGFAKKGVTLHLNGDVLQTFHALVTADILVMAKSSFSYAAALLNEGLVLYEPFWHSPLSGWVSVGEGTFDLGRFKFAFGNRKKVIGIPSR